MQMFEVGGVVRDELLGVKSKDVDFVCVLTNDEKELIYQRNQSPFDFMANTLADMGFKIFLETPEFLTVRAQFPGKGYTINHTDGFYRPYEGERFRGLTADFVLARKESDYTDGRRPDKVEPGTLEDDLARRDFCMNAIAKAADGSFIDPYNGRKDINDGIIRAVGNPFERLTEDALRAVRALRFKVTKGFSLDHDLIWAMQSAAVLDAIENKISDERIKDELSKMFRFDTVASLMVLNSYPALTKAMFAGSVSLDATMKTKGRGTAKNVKPVKNNLPVAPNGCTCICHVMPGVNHIAACCRETR